jgi:hypothetical protein
MLQPIPAAPQVSGANYNGHIYTEIMHIAHPYSQFIRAASVDTEPFWPCQGLPAKL